MRKSSLGPRRVSQNLRLEHDDQRASSSRRPLDVRRASGISQPGKNRRSSSENRDGRMSAIQPALKRFNSQHNLLATPANVSTTPLRGLHFGSAQSQKFTLSPFSDGGRSSRKSAYSGVGAGKPNRIAKDSRPLTDKIFLQQEIHKITSFLHSQPDALSVAFKGINLRQLTMKLFVDLVNFLMRFLDDNVNVNMANYVNEIPLIMKKWGYAGNLNSSWLKTVNTPHALPHVVGLLSWLVTCASCAEGTDFEAFVKNSLQNFDDVIDDAEADGFLYGNAQVYMPHLMKQYQLWNSREEAAEKNEEIRFIAELCKRNGVGDDELRECAEAIRDYEVQLSDPKEQAEIAALMEEEKKNIEFVKDYNNCLEYKSKMEEFLNSAETKLEEEKQKLLKEEDVLLSLQNKIMELKELISNQIMTVEERDELQKFCSELGSSIRENEEYIALVSNQTFNDDLEIVKRQKNIKKKTQTYNKIIIMESCWRPELKSLMDEINFFHPGAKEEVAKIESLALKLKGDIQNEYEKINADMKERKSELLQLEERKSLVLQDEEQHLEKVKQFEASIETFKIQSHEEIVEMKRTLNSLKASNEARISCNSLQMAKDQLQKLVEKREYGKAHIEKLKQKAESFFLKTTSCSRGFISTVLKAKTEYIRKIQDLLKNTEFFLEKTRSDFPLAGYLF